MPAIVVAALAVVGLLAVQFVLARRSRVPVDEALRRTNTLLQAQIEAAPLGILVVDQTGIVMSFNQRFVDVFHPAPPLRKGASVFPSLTAFAPAVEHPEAYVARIRYLYDHPEEDGLDEIVFRDGLILERHSFALRATSTTSLGRIWFFSDITAMRGTVRRAQDEQNVVTTLLDGLPGYFALIDVAGHVLRWNENLRLLNDRRDGEVTAVNPFEHVVEGDRIATIAAVRETIVKGVGELEVTHTTSRGIRTIRWHARRITVDAEPQILAVGTDVTDGRAAAALLRASEERFRIIFESVSDGIIVQDAVTEAFLDVNPRQHEMLGYTRNELLALGPADISGGSRADVHEHLDELHRVLPVEGRAFEWLFRTKDQRDFVCEVVRRYVNFGGRDVFLSTVRDISERKQATADVTYRDRILRALAVSTAELVSTASIANSMPPLLKALAKELGVDRILVIQRTRDGLVSSGSALVYGWQREGVPHVDMVKIAEPLFDDAAAEAMAAWLAPLFEGKSVATQAAVATGFVAQMMAEGHTLSSLLVPISDAGAYWGHFAVDDTHRVREWTSVEIDTLMTFADLVGALVTRERTAGRLQQSEEQFRAVSESVLDAIIIIGTDGRMCFWNSAAERIFGYSATEAEGTPIRDWMTLPNYHDERGPDIAGLGPLLGRTVELTATRKDGVEIAIELAINAMNVGRERFAVGVARDITERKRAGAEIAWMASHDMLTGLPNRRLFIEALDGAIRRARRSGQPFAVFSLDLDRFKNVNDTIGHPGGDRLLQVAAERLNATARATDTISRFGGDEFAVIQIDIREAADAAVLAEKFVRALDEPYAIDGNAVRSGTSIGIAVYGLDASDAEALLAHADVALYRAKAEGRGTYRFYTDAMDADGRARVTLDHELRAALAADQFVLLYQPRIAVDGRIVGIETFLRWRHPTRGIVEPETFFPAAERSGLTLALVTWVLREACLQIRCWRDAGLTAPCVAVNIAALLVTIPRALEETITSIAAEFGVPPSALEIELSTEAQDESLTRLRARGFGIVLDEFASGAFSLDRVRRFPVDRVKIAPAVIARIGSSDGTAVVRATLRLAKALGIGVIAAGVETAFQFDSLERWGCREMQGAFVAEPLAPADIAPLLRAGLIDGPYARP